MSKKVIAAFLMAALMLTFPACSRNDDEYGSVSSVEIPQEEDAADTHQFEAQDNPFPDYTYRTVEFGSAGFSYDIPKTWRERVLNHSCIRYDVPGDDEHFPGATFYVKGLFEHSAARDDLDPFAHVASEFSKPLSPYITGLPYNYEGKDAWIKSYTIADETSTPSFISDDTMASSKITRDVILMDKNTADVQTFTGMSLVATYFRWEDSFPVMFSAVVPEDSEEDARDLTEYVLSTVSAVQMKAEDLEERTAGSITFALPADFTPVNSDENIYISKDGIGCSAGISIGVFRVNEDPDILTEEYFQNSYTDPLTAALTDPSCAAYYTTLASMQEVSGNKILDESRSFSGSVSIFPVAEDYITAGMTYGAGGPWMINGLIVQRGDAQILIAALYPAQKDAVVKAIEKSLMQSISVKK